MDVLYNLMVRLSLGVGGFSGAAGAALGLLGKLEAQATKADAAVAGLGTRFAGMTPGMSGFTTAIGQHQAAVGAATAAQEQLSRATLGFQQILAGGAITAGGLLGVHVMKGWVADARDLQDALTAVGLATRGTSAQLESMRAQAFQVAGKTQFSAPDVLKMAQLAATGGINDRATLSSMLPTLARAAEVQSRLKGISFEESVPAMVNLAHQFQSYGAQPGDTAAQAAAKNRTFQSMIGRVVQTALVSNMTPDQLERSMAYMAQAHSNLGVSAAQALEFTAFASNVGITGGQGGGARLRQFFSGLAGIGSPASRTALHEIERRGGGTFFDAQGHFQGGEQSVTRAFAILEKASASFGDDQRARLAYFSKAFGAAGGMMATVGSTPEAQTRMAALQKSFAADPITSLDKAQETLNKTLSGQLVTLQTNIHSLGAMLGTELLPPLTAITSALVRVTSAMVALGSQHPWLVKIAAYFTLIATAAALIAGPILLIAGAINMIAAAGATLAGVGAAIGGVGAAIVAAPLLPILGIIALIAVAIGGIILLVTHWSQVTSTLGMVFSGLGHTIGSFFSWFGTNIHNLILEILKLKDALTFNLSPDKWFSVQPGGLADKLLQHFGAPPAGGGKGGTGSGGGASQSSLSSGAGTQAGMVVPNTRGNLDAVSGGLLSSYEKAARAAGVPLSLLLAQGARESDFRNVRQQGGWGVGVAQWDFSTPANIANAMRYLHAATPAAAMRAAFDPARATMGQAAYMHDLYRRYGSWDAALSAYNSGSPTGSPAYAKSVMDAAGKVHAAGGGGGKGAGPAAVHVHVAPGAVHVKTDSGKHASDVAHQVMQKIRNHVGRDLHDQLTHHALGAQDMAPGYLP